VSNSIALVSALLGASAFGTWHKASRGKIKQRDKNAPALELDHQLGERVTLLQFSSAFCAPCRTTKSILGHIADEHADVAHIEIDAEANLDLVRQLNILSTPTTIFLNRDGEEIARAVGAPKRDQVLNALAAIK
jgi:thiol-disulfide isomerase/thioredoxin